MLRRFTRIPKPLLHAYFSGVSSIKHVDNEVEDLSFVKEKQPQLTSKMGFGKLRDRLKQARRSSEDILQIVYMHNENFNSFHFVNALMYLAQNSEDYTLQQRQTLLQDRRFHILLRMSSGKLTKI